MLWKLLALSLVVFAFYAERLEKSSVFYTCKDNQSVSIDTIDMLKAWGGFFMNRKLRFVQVVTAQAMLETGYCTSPVYKECNNMFGMKMNGRGLARHKCLEHAYYNSVYDSVEDYRLYQSRLLYLAEKQGRPCETNEDYFALLEDLPHLRGHRYAEDLKYIDKLKATIVYMKNL